MQSNPNLNNAFKINWNDAFLSNECSLELQLCHCLSVVLWRRLNKILYSFSIGTIQQIKLHLPV